MVLALKTRKKYFLKQDFCCSIFANENNNSRIIFEENTMNYKKYHCSTIAGYSNIHKKTKTKKQGVLHTALSPKENEIKTNLIS